MQVYYTAFIVRIPSKTEPHYKVYFPSDGQVRDKVPVTELRQITSKKTKAKQLNADDYIGRTFEHNGKKQTRAKGVFLVKEIVVEKEKFKYLCIRKKTKGKKQIQHKFDMSFVVKKLGLVC